MKNRCKHILVSVALLFCGATYAGAQNLASGVVTDKTGSPIPGALISVKGTDITAVTGVDGTFSMDVPNTFSKLVFRYGGYGMVTKSASPGMEVKMRKSQGVSSGKWLVSFQMAVPDVKMARPAFGFMTGWCGKFGGYMKGVFRGDGGLEYTYSVHEYIEDLWVTGNHVATFNSLSWGAIVSLYSPVYAYAGLGCAWRNVYYELAGGDWVRSSKDSYGDGAFTLDLGLMFRYQCIMVNAGMIAVPGYGCAGNFGVGYCF